ncbi:MAG: calcium/sodium antiporter [Catenibacillus sp.]
MILSCFLLIIGFILLIKGADMFVDGSSSVAKLLKVPSIIIGLTIVAMGTSAPEAAVSITAAIGGQNDISVGNVVGSNFFNLLMVVGICALIRPMKVEKNILRNEFPQAIIIQLLLLVMCMDMWIFGSDANQIGRIDGLILLVLFFIFIALQVRNAKKALTIQNDAIPAPQDDIKTMSPVKSIIFIVVGIVLVIIGGQVVVNSATELARAFGLSEAFIGLTIVAVGTSLPELVTSIVAARKGENDLALGNVIGSNICNILLILGASAAIHPITVSIFSVYDLIILSVVSIVAYLLAFRKQSYNWAKGGVMIAMYVAYMVYIVMR